MNLNIMSNTTKQQYLAFIDAQKSVLGLDDSKPYSAVTSNECTKENAALWWIAIDLAEREDAPETEITPKMQQRYGEYLFVVVV
jgi:hypothetical protein